ncbi:MAG: DMP19 family protein [Candidatus Lokiarchaeota archaeon]|nr:DMP19 family protein [Candidatus Lokiarchaeota archaeon]
MSDKKVKKILENQIGQDAIIEIDNLLTPIFYQNPNKLSLPEKNIAIIEELEREINNGGFNQFFFNSAGDYSRNILTALKTIGSTFFLNIFERAIAMFPNSEVPKDRNTRQEFLEKIEEEANPIWEKLDREFYKYEEDIYSLMIDYIKNNINDFR